MGRYSALKQHLIFSKTAESSLAARALSGAGAGGLLGAGLGGGLGLLHEAFGAKPEDAQYVRRAIQGLALGALAGGGIGAGIGASSLGEKIDAYLKEQAEQTNTAIAEQVAKRLTLHAHNVPFASGPVPITVTVNSSKESKK